MTETKPAKATQAKDEAPPSTVRGLAAALCAWIVPGLGHAMLRRWPKALAYFIAVGVLAVCTHRASMPSTRFSLREPTTQHEARAREVGQWAQLRTDELRRFIERVAAAAGKPVDSVAGLFAAGTFMSAQEALDFGLLDEISRPRGQIHQMPGPPIGFRPGR